MKALVTGGAGFIGSNIVQALVERGDEVTVLDDLSSGYEQNLVDGASFVKGSILDADLVQDCSKGVNAIFHLAASVGNKRSIDDPHRDATTNVLGTINVMDAARRSGTRKVVYSSSAGIFGELKQLPIDESHPVEPDSPYGASKLAAEKECLAFSKLYDLEAVALRYFNVYGPNQRFDAYGNVIPIFVFQMLRGEQITIFGDGEQTRDFINVADVVQANLRAADASGVSGAFNLGSGTRISINDLAREIRARIPDSQAPAYGPERPGDVRDSLAAIDAAERAFGFKPQTSLSVGLDEYVEWARTEVLA